MTDDDSTSIRTLSREDALTLECEDTEDEFRVETFLIEPLEDDEDDEEESETESASEEEDWFWPTDGQVAAWEDEEALWRNPNALWEEDGGYEPNGEI